MDSHQRASVIGHTTMAIEDLKGALKAAKKGDPDVEVGQDVQRSVERLREVLSITGVQIHLSRNGNGWTPDHDEDAPAGEQRQGGAITGRPLLVEGQVMPSLEDEDSDGSE